jgi:hypothetical protein
MEMENITHIAGVGDLHTNGRPERVLQMSVMDQYGKSLQSVIGQLKPWFHNQSLEFQNIITGFDKHVQSCPPLNNYDRRDVFSYLCRRFICDVDASGQRANRKRRALDILTECSIVDLELRIFVIFNCVEHYGSKCHSITYQCLPHFHWINTPLSLGPLRHHTIGTFLADLTYISIKEPKFPSVTPQSINIFRVTMVQDIKDCWYLHFEYLSSESTEGSADPMIRPLTILYGHHNQRYVAVKDFLERGSPHFLSDMTCNPFNRFGGHRTLRNLLKHAEEYVV